MNKKIVKPQIIFFLAAMLFIKIGWASDFYVGGALGQSKVEGYEDYVSSNFDDGSIVAASFDDKDTALRVFVGMELNQNIAFEFGYLDLGEASTDATSDGSGSFYAQGPVKHRLSADGFDVGILLKGALSPEATVGFRAGLYKWDADEFLDNAAIRASGSEDGTDLFYAINGHYKLTPNLTMRGEYAIYKLEAPAQDFDVDLFSISLVYNITSR
jgi:OmpA-OmpF porin, OOP family